MSIIRNFEPRRDLYGDIIDAHDGCLEWFEDRYWLYGTRYGTSDGYQNSHKFVVYSSFDLVEWTPGGEIIPELPKAVHFRPYVKFCTATGRYVLWYYWTPAWKGTTNWRAGDGPVEPFRFAAAVGSSPRGPFQIVNRDCRLTRPSKGDHNLFQDSDGSCYIVYTSPHDDFQIMVEKLSSDYLSGSGLISERISRGVEAPCMFRRGDYYYVLCGTTCCFCPEGAGAQVYRSKCPLGPYERRNDINRYSLEDDVPGRKGGIIVAGQESFVATIFTPEGKKFLWMADLWESAPDKIKGHDFQYWSSPLSFDEGGDINPLKVESEWSVDLVTPGVVGNGTPAVSETF